MKRLTLLLLIAGCSSGPPPVGWQEAVVEPPLNGPQLVAAVSALPECGVVLPAGLVHWRPRVTCGSPPQPATSCAHPSETPPRIEVAFSTSAWEGPLASQLCRLCGYVDGSVADVQARACSLRAKYLTTTTGLLPPSTWQESVDPPLDTQAVVMAVTALHECWAVRQGGVIHWRPFVTCGSPLPVAGCAYPYESTPRIELVYVSSAWDGTSISPGISTLAHELCHVCGYHAEADADACALRAQAVAGR